MIIPIGHESNEVKRLPWITFIIIGLCLLIHIFTTSEMKTYNQNLQTVSKEIFKFYTERPYLELDKEIDKYFNIKFKGQEDDLFKDILSLGVEKPGPTVIAKEQNQLDQLTKKLLDIKKNVSLRKWGFRPYDRSFINLITYMFFHLGWLHLLGNMFFLYLCGPFIEDVWGKLIYSSLYVLAGMISALLYSFQYPQTDALIGASGAISGMMGVFLIRYWKTKIRFFYVFSLSSKGVFEAPAWAMLPIWFFVELFNAMMMHSANLRSEEGVAHWAHIWGFLFGVAIALILKWLSIEKKYLTPKEEPKSLYVDKYYQTFEEAKQLMATGKKEEAFDKLLNVAKMSASHPYIDEALWNLSQELGKEKEVLSIGQRLIESSIKRNQIVLGLKHYNWLKERNLKVSITNQSKIVLLEYLVKKEGLEDLKETEALFKDLLANINLNSLPGLVVYLAKIAKEFNKKCKNHPYVKQAVTLFLQHPGVSESQKSEFMQNSMKT
jgi:membrane associated rhomboid family serine protease